MEKIQNIEVSAIRVSPLNPRKTIDKDGLRELADNISQQGLLQPIIVREAEEKINKNGSVCHYEVVCGERRFRAVKSLGEKTIAAVVRVMDDRQALDAMITENLQRKDVDPMEEAAAFASLTAMGGTVAELSARFGKPERFIADRIRLDALIPELKGRVSEGTMDIGAAQHLCRLGEEEQRGAYEKFKDLKDVKKSMAEEYTRRIFHDISGAPWNGAFKGSCCVTCSKCQKNTANAGCLFYEMNDKSGRCTDPGHYEAKRSTWYMHVIEQNDKVIARKGCDFEKGQTLITYTKESYYPDACKQVDSLVEFLDGKGYRVVKKSDLFQGLCFYGEDDDRLTKKLKSGKVCRTIDITTSWNGVSVDVKYSYFREDAKKDDGEVEAMKLVGEYAQVRERSKGAVSDKLRTILGDVDPVSLPDTPLTNNESMAMFLVMAADLPYPDFEPMGIDRRELTKWCKENTGKVNAIVRAYLRGKLSKTCYGADYDAQLLVAETWCAEQTAKVVDAAKTRLAKRLDGIERRLGELGYNVDGTKNK